MSAKTIRGITIEIDGDTTGLGKALEGVNKQIGNVQYELRQVNSLLKLDPGNTELLAQKQELLAEAIKDTTSKLETLKTAKEQADARIANGSEEGASEGYRELVRQIATTEQSLSKLTSQSEETGKAVEGFSENTKDASKNTSIFADVLKANLLSEAIKKGLEELANSMKKVVSTIVDIGKESIQSYADYEQLIGGVETLFGESSGKLEEYASKAYETAGLSANEYMEQATSFSASLINSLDGDTEKAVDAANMAITDMADNANKMGTDISSIQNAYQGFAKQNYTMLDNLKLGYGGTKTEMERLLKDAQKISGIKYDISNLNDVYSAIHVVQEEMGITGTTAQEASETISGSFSTLQASWENFETALASGEGIQEQMDGLVNSIGNVINNVVPILKNVINAISTNLPTLVKTLLPTIASTALDIIRTLTETIINMLPDILDMGIQIILSLIDGLAEALPKLIPAIVDAILLMVETIIDNLDKIIEAALDIILALAQGLIDALPRLMEKIPTIIVKLVEELTKPEMLLKIVAAALTLILELAKGLIKAIPDLLTAVPTILTTLWNDFTTEIKNIDWAALGKSIINGIVDGLKSMGSTITSAVKSVGSTIKNGFKSFFGIHSPSTVMRDQVGKYLAQGIGEGIEDEIPKTIEEVNDAMTDLTSGIKASVNPTINTSANSNPLIIQIENFNNSREQDIEALAEELEFYRKMTATAKGGN